MITITFFAKEIEQEVKVNLESVTGFRIEGHAGYAKHGKDIVCAAVSALVMNTMNSIHSFTSDVFAPIGKPITVATFTPLPLSHFAQRATWQG